MPDKFAYTALPAVVTPIVYPPDWNPNWDFPGVYPPNYTPEFSIVATGANTTAVKNGISISSILYDHSSYATNEPSVDSEVIITAFVDGQQRGLKFSENSVYADAVYCPFVSVGGGLWGKNASLDVDIDLEEDDGKTLTFVVVASVDGELFTDTVSMTIQRVVWRGSLLPEGVFPLCLLTRIYVVDVFDGALKVRNGRSGGVSVNENGQPGNFDTGTVENPYISEKASSTKGLHTYSIDRYCTYPGYHSLFQFLTYKNGQPYRVYTKSTISDLSSSEIWLTFDSRDGTVTIINP